MQLPEHMRACAPLHGEDAINDNGVALLEMVHDNGLQILSGNDPEGCGPTFIRGDDSGVLDHVLSPREAHDEDTPRAQVLHTGGAASGRDCNAVRSSAGGAALPQAHAPIA